MFSKSQERITIVFGGGEGVVRGGDTRGYQCSQRSFSWSAALLHRCVCVCVIFIELFISYFHTCLLCSICNTKSHSTVSLPFKNCRVIWVWYWQCLGIPSEENHNLYQGALMRPGSAVCVSRYINMVIKSTLVRMGENNQSLWFLCLHSTFGGTKQKRKVRGKMLPTCFKISLGLKKQQCYWEGTTTAEGNCERQHFEPSPRLYVPWVIEST